MMRDRLGYLIGMLVFQIAILVIGYIPSAYMDIKTKLDIIVVLNCGLVGATVYNLVKYKS